EAAREHVAAVLEVVDDAARREDAIAGADVVHGLADDVGHDTLDAVDDLVDVHVMMGARHLRARRDVDLVDIGLAVGVAALGEKHHGEVPDLNVLTHALWPHCALLLTAHRAIFVRWT